MDVSSTIAAWLSLTATVLGLGSIVTQFRSIIDQTDPFNALRNGKHLGRWRDRQEHIPWYRIVKPPPRGPVIQANLPQGLSDRMIVDLSRLPIVRPTGEAGWSLLLSVIHSKAQNGYSPRSGSDAKSDSIVTGQKTVSSEASSHEGWDDLPLLSLVKEGMTTCTVISRTTFITLLCLTNARPVFRHSGAAGHRAAYASYCGQWRVEWPLGGLARVHFAAHDSHTLIKDVYPAKLERRVDKCLQMLAGVIDAGTQWDFRCAFPGRKSRGQWILEYALKGFGSAHGGRHLYNMLGGNVNEVDFLSMGRWSAEPPQNSITLCLPSKDGGELDVVLHIPTESAAVLNTALDCLPWTSLSWSVHRGLRDILVAFAKDRMDHYRSRLVATLRSAVERWPERLVAKGWDHHFVRNGMADMAAAAVLAGSGNSGDAVRIVTDIALILWDGTTSQLDVTSFWRYPNSRAQTSDLDSMAVIALVKCFALEWSVDLDYQMYHDFPSQMYLG